jgi:hypothetical protein
VTGEKRFYPSPRAGGGVVRLLMAALLILAYSCPASAALTGASASVTDTAGASRSGYSSTERLVLAMTVQNTSPASGNIQFSFEIQDPQGSRRFFQTGNSAPASVVGRTGATLRGIPISRFYTVPGLYRLTTTARLGTETTTATAQFTVLSPAITLTYPPNGARDLIDQPLTFRWVSSGASRYRITVDDDSSFYNALLTAETPGSFFAYPQNPPDQRQRLANGQLYYWKVDGLDAAGNIVARTDVPFSFTVKIQAAQSTSKDLAVVDVARVNDAIPGGEGAWPIAVFVKNQGGRPESNVPVNVFADGASVPTSPKRIAFVEPGNTVRLVFPVRAPDSGKTVLVNAILDFFDDNLQNNTMSRQFVAERPSEIMTGENAWSVLKNQVRAYLGTDERLTDELLAGGANVSIRVTGEGMSRSEVSALLRAVAEGKARVVGARFVK